LQKFKEDVPIWPEGIKQSGLHKFLYKRISGLAQGHFVVVSENESEVSMLYLSSFEPYAIKKITYNFSTKKLFEKNLYTFDNNEFERGLGLLIKDKDLFVSIVRNMDKSCGKLDVYKFKLDHNLDSLTYPNLIFETECVTPPYGSHLTGGKLENFKNGILLSVGSFGKDYLAAKKTSYLGKLILLRQTEDSYSSEIYSSGFRNPQGLLIINDNILLTDHGPQGGDEINLVKKGGDYGWPFTTYGIKYDENTESLLFSNVGAIKYGSHDDYEKPIYSFMPSIGIKDIIKINFNNTEFPNWAGDFILSGNSKTGLIRLTLSKNLDRVIQAEPLKVVDAVRDLVPLNNGKFFAINHNGLYLIERHN